MCSFIFIIANFLLINVAGLDNQLARTPPPMGWLSWERFRCEVDCKNYPDECISENLYMAMADRLLTDGYRDLGYVYVNIDDCWSEKARDETTRQLVPDRERFPRGIKWLADYMHHRGLKLGLLAGAGIKTCAGYPGSYGYFDIDAKSFASWKVDAVKIDSCPSDDDVKDDGKNNKFLAFARALNKTGRPMLKICKAGSAPSSQRGRDFPLAISSSCNLFRNFADIRDSFESLSSIISYYGDNWDRFSKAGTLPGFFIDPDVLITGNYGLSFDQQQLQLGMWAMFAAPFIMSNDLRKIDPESAGYLKNRRLIEIDQDALRLPPERIFNHRGVQIWLRSLSNERYAVAAINFNVDGTPRRMFKSLAELLGAKLPQSVARMAALNVFDNVSLGLFQPNDPIPFKINPTGIVLLIFASP